MPIAVDIMKNFSLTSDVLTREEQATFALRRLYAEYGYTRYKMSKFEEYDLYARNKEFLASGSIITFNDTDGRLMALKPDVTLSIIKNSRYDGGVAKLFYNENVYRVSKGTGTFREIMQVGLECIGDIGDAEIAEVIALAAKSLDTLSHDYVLEVSSLELVSAVLAHFSLSGDSCEEIIGFLGQKNAEGVAAVCRKEGIRDEDIEKILLLVKVFGRASDVLPKLEGLSLDAGCESALVGLARALEGVSGSVNIDFSVTGDVKYYNGIAFAGFIDGVPTCILSGGRYDKLAERISGRPGGAIGFAVYLDELGKLKEGLS